MKNNMGMKSLAGISLLIMLSVTGCVVRPAAPRPAPPAVRVEVVPRAPSPRHHWLPGHYQWRRGRYVWIAGRYRR